MQNDTENIRQQQAVLFKNINATVNELNKLLEEAHRLSMRVEIETREIGYLGFSYPQAVVTVKVSVVMTEEM